MSGSHVFDDRDEAGILDDVPEAGTSTGLGSANEELDMSRIEQRVWLVKVPKFLFEKWTGFDKDGVELGRVRVYDEKDSRGNPKISVLLPPSYAAGGAEEAKPGEEVALGGEWSTLPPEYKLTLQNTASKNLWAFEERIVTEAVSEDEDEDEDDDDEDEEVREPQTKKRRLTRLTGTIHHECSLTPSLSAVGSGSAYSQILRARAKAASTPLRTTKPLDVDQATANRLASGAGVHGIKGRLGMNVSNFVPVKPTGRGAKGDLNRDNGRLVRMDKPELLDLLFAKFENHPYWQIKTLKEQLKQPETYLREVLNEIGIQVKAGPYIGLWTLKPEWKEKGKKLPEVSGSGTKEEDADDDLEMVDVA